MTDTEHEPGSSVRQGTSRLTIGAVFRPARGGRADGPCDVHAKRFRLWLQDLRSRRPMGDHRHVALAIVAAIAPEREATRRSTIPYVLTLLRRLRRQWCPHPAVVADRMPASARVARTALQALRPALRRRLDGAWRRNLPVSRRRPPTAQFIQCARLLVPRDPFRCCAIPPPQERS